MIAAEFAKALVVALALPGHFMMTGLIFNGLYFYVSNIEQSLVSIIGCAPMLCPISKLQFPLFTAIGESLALFISRSRRSRKDSSSVGSSYHTDVEMGPHKICLNDERFTLHSLG